MASTYRNIINLNPAHSWRIIVNLVTTIMAASSWSSSSLIPTYCWWIIINMVTSIMATINWSNIDHYFHSTYNWWIILNLVTSIMATPKWNSSYFYPTNSRWFVIYMVAIFNWNNILNNIYSTNHRCFIINLVTFSLASSVNTNICCYTFTSKFNPNYWWLFIYLVVSIMATSKWNSPTAREHISILGTSIMATTHWNHIFNYFHSTYHWWIILNLVTSIMAATSRSSPNLNSTYYR